MKTKNNIYESPALEVLEIETEQCLAVSGGTEDMNEVDWDTEDAEWY